MDAARKKNEKNNPNENYCSIRRNSRAVTKLIARTAEALKSNISPYFRFVKEFLSGFDYYVRLRAAAAAAAFGVKNVRTFVCGFNY